MGRINGHKLNKSLGKTIGPIPNNFRGVNLNPYLTSVICLSIIQKDPTDKTLMTVKQTDFSTPKIEIKILRK